MSELKKGKQNPLAGTKVEEWGGQSHKGPQVEKRDASEEREQLLSDAHHSLKKHEQKYLTKITESVSENAENASQFIMGAHLLAIGRIHSEGNEDNSNLDLMTTAGAGKAYFEQFIETAKAEKVTDFLKSNNIRTFGGMPSKPGLFVKGGKIKRKAEDGKFFERDKNAIRRRIFHKMMLGVNAGEQFEIRSVIESQNAKKAFEESFLGGLPDENDPSLKYKPHGKEMLEAMKATIRTKEFSAATNQAATEEMISLSMLTYLSTLEEKDKPDEETLRMIGGMDPNFMCKLQMMQEHHRISSEITKLIKEETSHGGSGDQKDIKIDITPDGIIDINGRSRLNEHLNKTIKEIESLSYNDLFDKGFLPESRQHKEDGSNDALDLITPEETEEIKLQLIQQAYSPYNKLLSNGRVEATGQGDKRVSKIVLPNTGALEKCLGTNHALSAGSASYFFKAKDYREIREECQANVLKVMEGKFTERVARHFKIHGPQYIAIWQRGKLIHQMAQRSFQQNYAAKNEAIARDSMALGNI